MALDVIVGQEHNLRSVGWGTSRRRQPQVQPRCASPSRRLWRFSSCMWYAATIRPRRRRLYQEAPCVFSGFLFAIWMFGALVCGWLCVACGCA
eukprot:scaffold297_cov108-Isochrysis_galbana.AAC.8